MKKTDIYNYAMAKALQAIKTALHESNIQWNYNDAAHVALHLGQLNDLISGNVGEEDFLYQSAKDDMERSERISKIRRKMEGNA